MYKFIIIVLFCIACSFTLKEVEKEICIQKCVDKMVTNLTRKVDMDITEDILDTFEIVCDLHLDRDTCYITYDGEYINKRRIKTTN